MKKQKRKLNLPRVPLPIKVQTAHRPAKGHGSYNRQREKLALKREE